MHGAASMLYLEITGGLLCGPKLTRPLLMLDDLEAPLNEEGLFSFTFFPCSVQRD